MTGILPETIAVYLIRQRMKNILVIGGTGQIGSELTMKLRGIYGDGHVVCGYIPNAAPKGKLLESGPAEIVDITDAQQIADVVKKHDIDSIYNLAALLSAVAEARPQLACGRCAPCLRGQYNVCENLRVQAFQADGAAQDYFIVPEDRLVRLPETFSLEYGAMIEPAAVGAHATSRAGDLTGKNVVVSGAGTIGNLVAQFALARGARKVLITDVSDYRLETARKCGITETLNVAKTPLKEGLRTVFGDEGFQVGFEVAGVESSIRSLMECVEKGSTIVVVAVFAKDPALSMFFLGEHELILVGTMMYRHEDYLTAVEEITSGKVSLAPLVTNRFAFGEYNEAYRFIAENQEKCMKVIIDLEK